MSDTNSNSRNAPQRPMQPEHAGPNLNLEKGLEKMEAILNQAAMGIHVLFDHSVITESMRKPPNEKDFFDFNKMKRIQDIMTELVGKNSYYDKVAFLQTLDVESTDLLIRTYFHIVESTVRAASGHLH